MMIILLGVVQIVGVVALAYMRLNKGNAERSKTINELNKALTERQALLADFDFIFQNMVEMGEYLEREKELGQAREQLKAERGRNTITQAELETVESRLRELEEIERELEASGVETKEELKILKKKEKDLGKKNDDLKAQIQASSEQLQQIFKELELSAQMQEHIMAMQSELISTQTQVDTLMFQIEACNEQYFIFKQRYDALDIEYAQLYEKFSASQG
jgi:chromosome segregation ATPase